MNSSPSRGSALMLLDNEYSPDPRVEREAEALLEEGWEVYIICWDREGLRPALESPLPGLKVRRILTRAGRQLGVRQLVNLARFKLHVWRNRARWIPADTSVVHAHDLLMLPLAIRLRAWLGSGCRLVYDAHEVFVKMEARRYPVFLLGVIDRVETRMINRHVDALISVSRQRIDDWWKPRVREIPVHLCGNWRDPSSIDCSARRVIRESLDVSPETFLVGYIGGLNANRRVDLLVDAVAGRTDLAAVIGGRGSEAKALQERARRIDNIHLLGWLEDPMPTYAACDAIYYLIDPSHPYAAFNAPNNAHIALALGLPLVTGPEGEAGEMVQRTGLGRIVEPDAASVRRALLDLRKSPSDAGVEAKVLSLRSEWSWAAASRALRAAYSGVSESTPGAAP